MGDDKLILILIVYVFNCAIQALPDPEQGGSKLYRFVYSFAHLMGGNIGLIRKSLRKAVK